MSPHEPGVNYVQASKAVSRMCLRFLLRLFSEDKFILLEHSERSGIL